MRHWSRDTWLAAAVILYYTVIGLVVLRPEAVYSGDIGVKYVQAQAVVDHRFRSLDIPYPGDFLDPDRRFFPLRPPFVMTVGGGAPQAIFPPASTVIEALGVAVAGFRGMIVMTLIGGAVTILAARRLAPERDRFVAVLALGLASPLWFYAISGWEHAPAVGLGVLAFAIALRSPLPAAAFLAGIAVGAGATIRDEVILLVPGVALAAWIRTRGWRAVAQTVGGVLVPLALAMALEVWWFGRPPAAHVRHAVHVLQTALNVTTAPNPDVPVLQPITSAGALRVRGAVLDLRLRQRPMDLDVRRRRRGCVGGAGVHGVVDSARHLARRGPGARVAGLSGADARAEVARRDAARCPLRGLRLAAASARQ